MVVHVEPASLPEVISIRQKIDPTLEYTHFVPTLTYKLPAYKYYEELARNIKLAKSTDSVVSLRPELNYPEYCAVILSKTSLVRMAAQSNTFNTECFMWVDAGLCRESFPNWLRGAYYPADNQLNRLADERTHLVCLSSPTHFNSGLQPIPKDTKPCMAGGWFAGTRYAIESFDVQCRAILDRAVPLGFFGSEQTIFAMAYLRSPEMFTLLNAGWYDGFLSFSEGSAANRKHAFRKPHLSIRAGA